MKVYLPLISFVASLALAVVVVVGLPAIVPPVVHESRDARVQQHSSSDSESSFSEVPVANKALHVEAPPFEEQHQQKDSLVVIVPKEVGSLKHSLHNPAAIAAAIALADKSRSNLNQAPVAEPVALVAPVVLSSSPAVVDETSKAADAPGVVVVEPLKAEPTVAAAAVEAPKPEPVAAPIVEQQPQQVAAPVVVSAQKYAEAPVVAPQTVTAAQAPLVPQAEPVVVLAQPTVDAPKPVEPAVAQAPIAVQSPKESVAAAAVVLEPLNVEPEHVQPVAAQLPAAAPIVAGQLASVAEPAVVEPEKGVAVEAAPIVAAPPTADIRAPVESVASLLPPSDKLRLSTDEALSIQDNIVPHIAAERQYADQKPLSSALEKVQSLSETSQVAPKSEDIPQQIKSSDEQHQHLLTSGEKSAELKSQLVPEPVVAAEVKAEAPSKEAAGVEAKASSSELESPVAAGVQPAPVVSSPADEHASKPQAHVVLGGLGPLNLLAETLCSSQPERVIAPDELNALYAKRAALRKSLYSLMSLKFTHLDKINSRLNYANIAQKKSLSPEIPLLSSTTLDASSNLTLPSSVPSHGWPVVGKCTAHDLKLMAEAAWCEDRSDYFPIDELPMSIEAAPKSTARSPRSVDAQQPSVVVPTIPIVATVTAHASNSDLVAKQETLVAGQGLAASAAKQEDGAAQPYSYAAVISKVLHVNQAPFAEEVSAKGESLSPEIVKSRECRKKALRLSKALFNHLAENQAQPSESWPQLYAALYEDECARKRVVDIVTALSNFRGETSSTIRRDNVEFAFAMDDLRPKVLKSEINAPLTFDRQFIEVEQFLQQSVKLLMSNIDPERAKLTQLRYRSLMSGPVVPDDQCVELHQRLLAKNYPSDCNPNQFGQLTDVLRMTAMSLDLWSVEAELAKAHAQNPLPATQKLMGIQDDSLASQPVSAQALQDCISYLVVG